MSLPRTLSLPLLAFLPLFLACGSPPFPLQETALAGSAAELRSFEGNWYSEAGDLIAMIEAGRQPRLAVRLYSPYLHLDEAHVEKGSIRFAARGEQGDWTVFGSARLMAPDRLSLQQLSAQGEPIEVFLCGNEIVVPRGALLRDPSSWWLAKRSAQKAKVRARWVYEDTSERFWDRISRIL